MPAVSNEWTIRISSVVLVFIATIYGTLSGALIPLAACLFTGIILNHPEAFFDLAMLMVSGLATGHYAEKLGVLHGRFTKWFLLDFVIIVTGAEIVAWLCVRPLLFLYAYGKDLRITIDEGLLECMISVAVKLCICLPLLLIANHFFRKRQMIEDAKREYLYHSGK
jgi:hypothetical protein